MRATAIIVKDGMILLIHRFRDGNEFFVLPGGGVEEGETVEEALIREVKEETNLDVKKFEKRWEHFNDYGKRMHHYYLITEFSGEVKLGGDEAQENSPSNSFNLEWHKLTELSDLPIKPDFIKDKLINEISSVL